jgi:hypothetical protein
LGNGIAGIAGPDVLARLLYLFVFSVVPNLGGYFGGNGGVELFATTALAG